MWTPTHVKVTVLRARNLLGKGKNGLNDVFVVIQLKKEKFHTSVKEMTVNPEWHEECDLSIPDGRSSITITLSHRNIIGIDSFLGEIALPLSDFDIYERPKSRWFTLESKANKKHKPVKDRGEVEIKLEFIVKDIPPASTPLPERKKLGNSLINLATDVGSKLNSKFPSHRLSLKIGKKLTKSDKSVSGHSMSEEDSSLSSSQQDFNSTNDNYDLDSEPTSPNESTERQFSQRSMSLAAFPAPTTAKNPSSDWGKLFGRKFENVQVQSMEDIRSEAPVSKQNGRSGSLSNLRSLLTQPPPQRRNTSPHGIQNSHSLKDNNNSNSNQKQSNRRVSANMPLKPCYEDEPLITISNNSKITQDVLNSYGALNREELLNTIVAQKLIIEKQRNKMKDMENYIDNLLVRVMNSMPKLLQKPLIQYSRR